MRDECIHGSLRRKCEICRRDEDIARLQSALRCFFTLETDEGYMARAMKDIGIDYEELRKEIMNATAKR